MASVKQAWIKKFGEQEGLRRWEEQKKKFANKNSIPPVTKNQYKYWTDLGYSMEEARVHVSIEQRQRSPLCPDYYKKRGIFNDEDIKKHIVHEQRLRSKRCKEFYLKHGITEDEANNEISKYQSILSIKSSKFKDHSHSINSKEKISKKLKEYWDENDDRRLLNSTFTKNKVQQEIKKYGKNEWLRRNFGNKRNSTGRVSNLERSVQQYLIESINSVSYKFNKFIPNTSYVADILINDKLIIEVYGDYWHANPEKYKFDECIKYPGGIFTAKYQWDRDQIRINNLKDLGYKILVIWQNDWIKNSNEIKEQINKFINENI